MRERKKFRDWLERQWWFVFDDDDFRICGPACPKEGEYANNDLQQLWECWQYARKAK